MWVGGRVKYRRKRKFQDQRKKQDARPCPSLTATDLQSDLEGGGKFNFKEVVSQVQVLRVKVPDVGFKLCSWRRVPGW